MNTGGSVLCSNSSFSSLLPSPNTDSTQGTVTLPGESTPEPFDDGQAYSFDLDSGDETTSILFSHCRFTGDKYSSARPLTFSNYLGTISILSCSFTDITFQQKLYAAGGIVLVLSQDQFDRLSFKAELSNFTSCSTSFYGGAMWISVADDVLIDSCLFDGCSTREPFEATGGGLHVSGSSSVEHVPKYELVDCVFADCQSRQGGGLHVDGELDLSVVDTNFERCGMDTLVGTSRGGGIDQSGKGSLTVERCQFVECSSRFVGSAIGSRYQRGKLTISDTLVKDCVSGTTGAICIIGPDSSVQPTFSHVFLDGNSMGSDTDFFELGMGWETNATKFPDVAIMGSSVSTLPKLKFEDCFTTVIPDSTGVVVAEYGMAPNWGIPERHFDPEFTKIGPFLTAEPIVRVNGKIGKIELELKGQTPPISQEYEVTVEEDDGTETSFKMLFSGGTGTLVSPSEVSLKYNTDYTITKIVGVVPESSCSTMTNGITIPQAAWAFNLTLTFTSLSFTTPEEPPILKASCRVGSGTDHAWIRLTGLNITAGTYSVKLKDVAFSFEVTFSDQKDENGLKQSSEASIRLFGEGSTLTFDAEYTLESVTDSALNDVELRGVIVTFSTPQSTERIVGIGTMDFTSDQKDEVSVSLSGFDLSNTEYIIEISPSNLLNDDTMSVAFTDQSGKVVGSVYSADGEPVHFKFGKTYEIVSITRPNNQPILLFDTLAFDVPTEPARIESTSSVLNGSKTEVTVTLTGRKLFLATMTVKVKNPNSNREFTTDLLYVDSSSCTVTFAAGQTETDTELAFGVSYDIVSIESSDGKSFVVNTGVKVSVPSAPIITSISSLLSPNCTHFSISFSGSSLPKTGSLVASISPSISLSLSYENEKWTTGWLLNGTNGMLMNTSYSVTKVASGENEMILNMYTFTTALGPTLSSIPTVTLKDADLNSVVLSLDGLRMPVSSVVPWFDLIVVESGGSTEEIKIGVSFSSNSVGSGEVEVYKSRRLKYSTSYSVVGMSSTVVSVSIPSAVTFTTPAAPTRIISASCDLDTETGKSAEIVLNGVSFPQSTPFTLTVFELDDSKVRTGNAIELSSSFGLDGSSTTHTLSSLIYGNDESKLTYGKCYEITKLEIANMKTIVDDLARFVVPPEPSRLTTVTLPAVYSEKETKVSVTLSGIKLTGLFTVTLKSNVSAKPNDVVVTFSAGSSGDLKGVLYSRLSPSSVNMTYETKYSIVSMKDSSNGKVFMEEGLSFTTMKEPSRVVSVWISGYENDEKEAILRMDGRELDVLKKYEVSLLPGNVVVSMSFADGKWEGRVGVRGSDEAGTGVIYGETYTVDSVVISNTQVPVHCDDISFPIKTEPARLIYAALTPNDGMNISTLTLTTRQLVSNQKYTVSLSGTPIQPSNSDSVHTLDFEVDGAPSITTELSLYPVATLRFNHLYKVTSMKMKSSSTPIFIESEACSFSTPAEPTRIVDGDGRLNSQRTEVVVTLTGFALKAGSYSFTLTHSNPVNSRIITGSLSSNGFVECSHTVEENNANHLMFGETYTITSATLNGEPILFDSNIHIGVPRPPQVTAATIHPNTQNTALTIELSGTELAMMKEYTVTLRPSFSFVVLFADASRAISPTLRIGTSDGLDANTEYFVESIVGVMDSDDIIFIVGSISFTTPEATLMEVVVSSSGEGREGEECGSLSLPCETLLIGWEMGKKGGAMEKIVLRVRDAAESGGVVVVGRASVEVRGMFGEKGRIMISEQATASTKSESVFLVDGGEILLLDLFVSVPSFTSVWGWRPDFVVGGEGTVIVKGVEMVCEEGGKAGMGLVGLEQGRLEVDHLFVRNIAFSEGAGLIRCLGGQNELTTDISNLVVQNTTLSEGGIIAFSSTKITSEISMTDSEIDQVRMRVDEGTDKALVSIQTQQTRLTISKCVFFESGCEHATGVKIGQALLITLHSSEKDETVQRVDVHSCLFVDCAGGDESGEGGVVIRSGEGLSRVSLSGSWFEERSGSLSPSSFERDTDGRVVVTKRRMWLAGWKRGGVVVERGRRLPVIDRKGSGFSNCGLIVREKEVERGKTRNEEKNEL
ncbi:hypothetical protein BLNAU_8284 [Blattamonas nauphoetae]|uniref:Uncharacterized protein n=1 Tax=Blattamonas nauphoetae TaxID=2049346 RepID=A0ABQ9XZD3_9EUKA|nr:hypothetical protein BLNAU_8284 [Blattamonas nauphoetae]